MDLNRPTLIPILAAALVCLAGIGGRAQRPAQDQGAAGTWQKIRKLQTTASAMHTTAHPDDEQGGMLALLSRGQGARVSLLTLTRGESGDNAIGPELFDALGLIRTEELLVADRYYGVDNQYFTSVADYGFSKRLDEALEKWGREYVLRDVVRIIRMDRPMVVISRFQGNPRDGHGNHEAAGVLTQEAFRMAGDPMAFPEQLKAGLRPWQPLKLYMGGVRENEDWNLRIDTGVYDPALGESYQTFARLGLSFQRSQNSGRFSGQAGPPCPTTGVWRWRQASRSPSRSSRSSMASTPRFPVSIARLATRLCSRRPRPGRDRRGHQRSERGVLLRRSVSGRARAGARARSRDQRDYSGE